MIKIFKPLVGKTIYLIPTGNSVTKGVSIEEQIKEVTLLKVGNKLLTTTEGKYNYEGELDFNNFGYIHFISKQEAEEHFLKKELEQKFRKAFSTIGGKNFTYHQLSVAWSVLND